jgi:sulfate adenylyltransferase
MVTLKVSPDIIQDAINIKNGVYTPLLGFLHQIDYQPVLADMRLANGEIWPIPIVVNIGKKDYEKLNDVRQIVLVCVGDNSARVILKNIEVYPFIKKEYAQAVYGTVDEAHPGVAEIMAGGDYLLGGEVAAVEGGRQIFSDYNFIPEQTKKIFYQRGWRKIASFQTRNVPHRGHEFLQKKALKEADGIFIQPVIGPKKNEDFKDEYIISAYEILRDKYFPAGKMVLGVLPIKMRYAGPREAVMHALIRRNFGCTHFIVGRDHAGVGDYYAPRAAQEIFNRFRDDEIGIHILKFAEVGYNRIKKDYCFIKEEESNENIIRFSGTKLRTMIKAKERPPVYLIRPEVYELLSASHNSLVDDMYKKHSTQKGFTLWFTGFSSSGKSTIADAVYEILKERGVKTERLDGDVVRENLTRDLGFSKEDRDENIRRVGFVARLLASHGVGVIASFISPYRAQREGLRKNIPNFIEVFVDAPIEVCMARDVKGLYKKAHVGEIKNFTGVDDPYEEPLNPEIHLRTNKETIVECAQKVIDYLKERGLV